MLQIVRVLRANWHKSDAKRSKNRASCAKRTEAPPRKRRTNNDILSASTVGSRTAPAPRPAAAPYRRIGDCECTLATLAVFCHDDFPICVGKSVRWMETRSHACAASLNIPSIIARLLILRGVTDPESAQRFLNPALDQLHNPFLLADMKTAVERLRRALEQKEKILIYGDYDVDGTMAVVILLAALRGLGGDVEAYIPHRMSDGYGMRAAVLEEAAAKGVRVVVSVDTGIREHEALIRARDLGLDCIVTDHHLPDEHLPPACAILNPQRADSGYPEKVLAGVGVAFKLVQALLGERLSGRLLQSYLKVVAIGTIADVVPLLGENRVIARFGLEALRQPSQAGLQALLEVSGLERCRDFGRGRGIPPGAAPERGRPHGGCTRCD